MTTFRSQHQSLLQFKGVLGLFKPGMEDEEKIALAEEYWEPEIRENMVYWLAVCCDREAIPFDPIPYGEGGTTYREDPLATPMELVDMLYEELNTDEAMELLKDLEGHMFGIAYNAFRRVLSRDLSCVYVTPNLADKIMETIG